jgi:hypothetical protein
MFQKKNQSVKTAKSLMFKQYPLTIAMFLAGTCALLMALSISLSSDPNVSNTKEAAVDNLHAKIEKFNINSRGGDGGAVHGVVDPQHIN